MSMYDNVCGQCRRPFDDDDRVSELASVVGDAQMRARLEKVRDKLAECRYSSVRCSAQIRNEEALYMLEAILEWREP